MINPHLKKEVLLLIGIFYYIVISSSVLNSSHYSLKNSNQTPKVILSAKNVYELDFNFIWSGETFDMGREIALDASGNIYIVGSTTSFGEGAYSAFLAKFDNDGNSLLNITWGGDQYDYGKDIAVDLSGNIYIMGFTNSYGEGDYDAFIVKYNSAGIQQWNTTWGDIQKDHGDALVLDDSGNIYMTGITRHWDVEWKYSAFIAKFDNDGNSLLNITWDSGNSDNGEDIALDASGNIYITGETNTSGTPDKDGFIAKYNSAGIQQWNSTWGSSGKEIVYGITLDILGNIYITGYTDGFGAGGFDAFIAKFDNNGNYILNNTWGGKEGDFGEDIEVDSLGNIYISGSSSSMNGGFIAKFNAEGHSVRNITGDELNWVSGKGIELDVLGNIYITGETKDYFKDAFLSKFDLHAIGSFELGPNLTTPDIDGSFWLNWSESIDADNYSIYWTTSPNVDENDFLYIEGLNNLTILIKGFSSGTYYFRMIAYNEEGSKWSNEIIINIQIVSGDGDDDDKENELAYLPFLMIVSIIVGSLIVVSAGFILTKKKQHGRGISDKKTSVVKEKPQLQKAQPFYPPKSLKIGVYCASCNTSHSITREQFEHFSCGGCGNYIFNVGYFCRNCNKIYPISKNDYIDLQEPEEILCYKCNGVAEILKSDK